MKSSLQMGDVSLGGGKEVSTQERKNSETHFDEQLPIDTATSNHPDSKSNNLTIRCLASTQENISLDTVLLANQQEMYSSLIPLPALEVASDQHHDTIGSCTVAVRASSTSAAGIPSREMMSSLKQSLSLPQDFEQFPSDSKAVKMTICHSNQETSTFIPKGKATGGDTALRCHQNTTVSSIFPLADAISTNSLRSSDSVKHLASSSVKSYESNLGSDDCGGSLDVETHSDDARSIDGIFPVSMLDQDPETVAVAALSINPAESNDCNRFADRYNGQGRFMPLTLQRFHRSSADSRLHDEQVGMEVHSQKDCDDSASWRITREDTAVATNWNDPRIDSQSSHDDRRRSRTVLDINEDLANSRRRSRSRTPPTQH